MLKSRIFALAMALCASIGAALIHVVVTFSSFIPKIDISRLIGGFPSLSVAGFGGDQVDAATFQRSRHEANVSRRSADRHN